MKRNGKHPNLAAFFASIIMMLISFGACLKSKDSLILPKDEKVTVTFSLTLSGNHSGIKTYAVNGVEVEEVDVLVFAMDGASERFSYHSIAKDLEPGDNPGEINFTTSLRKDENAENEYRLIILANVRQQLNAYGINIGQTKEYFKNNFIYTKEIPDDNWNTPLPMWGESDVITDVGSATEIAGISLLRSMAGVDVVNQAGTVFTLTDVYVFNSKTKGLVIPNSDSPSLPVFAANDTEILAYAVPAAPNELKNEVYLFEAAAGMSTDPPDPGATALVIGGTFATDPDPGNPTTYYYRIDFRDENGNLVPLLRNNRYIINIINATGTGLASTTKEDAFASPSLPKYAYIGLNGLKPARSERQTTSNVSITRAEIVPSGTGAINYTITTVNENQ